MWVMFSSMPQIWGVPTNLERKIKNNFQSVWNVNLSVYICATNGNGFRRKRKRKMGQIRIMEKTTLAELAETYGWKYDTLFRKAKRIFPSEAWAKNSVVTEEIGRVLIGDVPPPRPAPSAKRAPRVWTPESGPNGKEFREALPEIQKEFSNQPAPAAENTPAPGRAKFTWPSVGLSEFLALAVYGHTALVWYELWVIFQVPGILAGIVLFALKHAAVVICRAEKYEDYAADALGVAFVLDGLAVWVHYTAFGDAMPDRFKDGAEFWAALVLGLVVAAGAFVTLYFTNKTAKQ